QRRKEDPRAAEALASSLRLCVFAGETFSFAAARFGTSCRKTRRFFHHFRTGTALAKHSATTSGHALKSPEGITEEKKMTNRHTLKFSIFAAGILALALPAAASAQWGGYPQDRYPDNRGYGRYDDRGLRDSVNRLDRVSKDFERDMDRALDHSRVNGSNREDRINDQVHQFRNAVRDLKSRVGNGRDLNRSSDEARRVIQEADQLDRAARRGFDGRTSSEWSQIQSELR